MIRVGGGYATMEEYLRQNAPFECIKILKTMRDKKCTFKKAVSYYLEKHNASKRVVQNWLKADSGNEDVFEQTVEKLQAAQS